MRVSGHKKAKFCRLSRATRSTTAHRPPPTTANARTTTYLDEGRARVQRYVLFVVGWLVGWLLFVLE